MALKLAHQTRVTPVARNEVATKEYIDGVSGKESSVLHLSGRVSHMSQDIRVIGAFEFDPDDYQRPGAVTFPTLRVVAAMGDVGNIGHIRFVNDTDEFSMFAFVYTATTILESSASSNFLSGSRVYRMEVKLINPPSPTDSFEIYSVDMFVKSVLTP